MRALWVGATGLTAGQVKAETHAHNVANLNTTGFKARDVLFAETMYRRIDHPDRLVKQVPGADQTVHTGGGTLPVGTRVDQRPGDFATTGGAWHLAIAGDGYFTVGVPDAYGGQAYTRAGEFRRDGRGAIVDGRGNPLLTNTGKPLIIPAGVSEATVQADGHVISLDAEGRATTIGRLRITRFANPDGLTALGAGLFTASVASGAPLAVDPGSDTLYVQQGVLEQSNVDLTTEMVGLMTAQRSLQFAARVVQTADEMLALANRIYR